MHVNIRTVLVFALMLSVSSVTPADTLFGKVVGVTDGDTITVLDGQRAEYKIRLAGIDCPYMQVIAIRSR